MLINVHQIKNYSANVVNRGEDGEPKSVIYGGKKRTRISSACRKHAWRESQAFQENWQAENISLRTRKVSELVRDSLIEAGYSEAVAVRVCSELGKSATCPSKELRVYSRADVDAITEYVKEQLCSENAKKQIDKLEAGKELKKDILDIKALDKADLPETVPVDVALFGRMMPSRPSMNVPAACNVAHAFTTHTAVEDVDFFTATDDLVQISSEESGAGHLDDISFDTACTYEYESIDTDILLSNLKDMENKEEVLLKILETIIPVMVMVTPEGKQTTMAARPAPSMVLIEVQDKKLQFDYANAFEDAIWGSPIVKKSIEALVKECTSADKMFGAYRNVTKRVFMTPFEDISLDNAERAESLKELVDKVVEEVEKSLDQ